MLDAAHVRQEPWQVHREAEPRAPSAKSVNRAARAPDAAWRALVANPDRPLVSPSASVPVNAITGWIATDEIRVAVAAGKALDNRVPHPGGAGGLVLLQNSGRPTLAPGRAMHVNSIGAIVDERKGRP